MSRRNARPRPDDATDPRLAGGRWRLRNWRLRTRLIVVLLIPALAALVLAGLRVREDLDSADSFEEGARRIPVDRAASGLVHALQRERDVTVAFVADGGNVDRGELRQQRGRVDAAIGTFSRTLTGTQQDLSTQAVAGFRQVEPRLDGLTELRYAAENSSLTPDDALVAYRELVSGLLDLGEHAMPRVHDDEAEGTSAAIAALARFKDAHSARRALVTEVLAAGVLSEEHERALYTVDAEISATRDEFLNQATPSQRELFNRTVAGADVDTAGAMADEVLVRGQNDEDLSTLGRDRWDAAATGTVDLVKQVQDELLTGLGRHADTLAADARRSALIESGAIVGVLLVGGLLALLIARSLLRPLRALRRSALEVAQFRLPEAVRGILTDPDPRPESTRRRSVDPVPVFSREELGQVARAFDAVHGEAVRLAGEQAVLRENVNSMFVNLSRRSQNLVERQLSVLDRMEEHEQDPDILGGLFELDHLATRMRRNSENLLVLAGQEEAGRPLPGVVGGDEILGAALSEVEHYQRINVVPPPRLGVVGDAVADLVHVISELFENATAYSPAHEPVSVESGVTSHGEWWIDITDRGAGMPETEIRRANERLADVPQVDVEVSRRMGLYVVARLAGRHDIRVWLAAADVRGLTATVLVPAALVRLGDPAESDAEITDVTEAIPALRELPLTGERWEDAPEDVAEPVDAGIAAALEPAAATPGAESGYVPDVLGYRADRDGIDGIEAIDEVEVTGDLERVEAAHAAEATRDTEAADDIEAADGTDADGTEDTEPVDVPDEPPYGDDQPTELLAAYDAEPVDWPAEEGAEVTRELPELALGDPGPAEPMGHERHEPEGAPIEPEVTAPIENEVTGPIEDPSPVEHLPPAGDPMPVGAHAAPADPALDEAAAERTVPIEHPVPAEPPEAAEPPGIAEPREPTEPDEPTEPGEPSEQVVNRSPEAVRARMASLQQGVRRGRHARTN